MWSVTADSFTATPGVERVYEGHDATLIWEYGRQLGSQDWIRFYCEGYKSGGDYILTKVGNGNPSSPEEYEGRITYTGSGQRTGFILQDIVEGDVTDGRYSILIVSTDPDVPDGNNEDAIISIYRK